MKNLTLFYALGLAVVASAYACGSDVDNPNTTTNTGGSASGGTGGTSGSSSSSSASSSGSGGFANVCDEACDHLDTCIGLAGACGLVQSAVGIDISDCTMMEAECLSTCIVDADCQTILTLAPGGTPDPALTACLTSCQGDTCLGCMFSSCSAEVTDCNNDTTMVCPAFAQCVAGCAAGDASCINACAATAGNNAETQALLACANTQCPTECLGQGGGGGSGGGGGAGGQGGN